MKINFTVKLTAMTGGIRFVFEIANRLVERGHDVTITALGGDHRWFPLKAEVNYVPLPKFFKFFDYVKRLIFRRKLYYYELNTLARKIGLNIDMIKVLAKYTPDCDVNIATRFLTAFAVYRSNKGIPVYLCQDFEESVAEKGDYYLKMFYESLNLPMHFITISEWMKEWLSEYSNNVFLVRNGINHDIFYPRNVEKDGKYVMGIYRDLEYKGGKELIEALKIIKRNKNDVKTIVLGKDFGDISYNRVSDKKLSELYNLADVFIYTSKVEGFGLPPLEAMACGTAVVTTDCKGVREYMEDGKNGFIVPRNPKKIAEKSIELLEDEKLRRKIARMGIKTAKKYNWDRSADEFEKILYKIV